MVVRDQPILRVLGRDEDRLAVNTVKLEVILVEELETRSGLELLEREGPLYPWLGGGQECKGEGDGDAHLDAEVRLVV